MKKTALLFLLSIAALGVAEGATFLSDYANTTNGVAVTAGFLPDSLNIVVGEPLFLTFVVSNRAEQPFQFSHVHNSIFSVTATDSAGKPVMGSYIGLDGNGFAAQESVASGTSYSNRIFLNERCKFEEPGVYAVTCRCGIGFFSNPGNSGRQFIVSTFNLTVGPSDPKRATEIIARWSQVVETNGALNEAAQALAEIDDPRTIPPLAVIVSKNPDNDIAVYALTGFTNEAAADALVIVLKRAEDYCAGHAGAALRKSHQNDRIAGILLPALANSDPAVRIETARAVSWTASALAFAPLCSLLLDGNAAVRYASAEAVGRLGDSRSFGVLTNCLSNSDFALRISAVRGLLALGRPLEPAWVTPMILSGGENVRTYYDAIDLLRMRGGDLAAPGLAGCLHFDDPSVRHSYNMRLMLALEYSPNGPKYYYKWHSDPNRDGTAEELAENRQILSELKVWLDQRK